MDFASIVTSAGLSAVLFIVLEFTIILPLFRKIVTNAVNEMVTKELIPSVDNFVDSKVHDLTDILTKSLFVKIKGMLGGRRKGVNSILDRLAAGEDLEDIEDEYEPSTIEKVLDIVEAVRPFLPNPSTRAAAAESEHAAAAVDGIKEL
jgi:hypothetical protein